MKLTSMFTTNFSMKTIVMIGLLLFYVFIITYSIFATVKRQYIGNFYRREGIKNQNNNAQFTSTPTLIVTSTPSPSFTRALRTTPSHSFTRTPTSTSSLSTSAPSSTSSRPHSNLAKKSSSPKYKSQHANDV